MESILITKRISVFLFLPKELLQSSSFWFGIAAGDKKFYTTYPMIYEEEQQRIPLPEEFAFNLGPKKTLIRTPSFVVEFGKMLGDWEDKKFGIKLSRGEVYLELHFLPNYQEGQKPHVQEMRRDIAQMARFLQEKAQGEEGALQAKYILGITDQKVSELAQKYLHATVSHEVPAAIVALIRREYSTTPMAQMGRELGIPAVCLWKIDDFIAAAEEFSSRR